MKILLLTRDLLKKILANSNIVYCEIPLNRYSFFEVRANNMLPDAKFELHIKTESDIHTYIHTLFVM